MSSVFDAPTTEQTTTQTQTENTIEDWVSEVVKEKGEQWQDPQALAKGYYHAQKRIKELEALEEKQKEQDYAKTLLEQLQAQQAPEATTEKLEVKEEPQGSTEQKDDTSLSPEDIERLLETKLTAKQNRDLVESSLKSKFGEAANQAVAQAAQETGFSTEELIAMAESRPQAFLKLVGEPAPKETNKGVRTSVNTASGFNSQHGERDSSYYAKIRRENRKLYYSPETQQQMIQDRMRLGDKF